MGTMLAVLPERKPDALGAELSHRRRWNYCAQHARPAATVIWRRRDGTNRAIGMHDPSVRLLLLVGADMDDAGWVEIALRRGDVSRGRQACRGCSETGRA